MQTIDRSKPSPALVGSVLSQVSALLHPKLKRLLNPNVVDASIRIQLHIGNGALNHIRDVDSEPSYVSALPECGEHNPKVADSLKVCLRTIGARLQDRLGGGWHGIVTLLVAISCGEPTISSEADGCHKPACK